MENITKPLDFTGCDPVVAGNLKKGLATKCAVRGADDYIIAYISGNCTNFPYKGERDTYQQVRPIEKPKTETVVKKASELVKWFEDNNCILTEKGWFGETLFTFQMFSYCGELPDYDHFGWHEDWLEEVEI